MSYGQATTSEPTAAGLNLFSGAVLADPHPHYDTLREQAAVVHLEQTGQAGVWAITRYAEIREALADTSHFSSAATAFTEPMNKQLAGTILASDGAEHKRLRKVQMTGLSPRMLRDVQPDIEAKADVLVAGLARRGTFEAIADLATTLPLAVVLDLIGLRGPARDKMTEWGNAAFNALGGPNARTRAAMPAIRELAEWSMQIGPDDLAEGGVARQVFAAADEGVISREAVGGIIQAYVAAGLETTVAAIGNSIAALATHPDQQDLLRADPSLIPAAFDEVMRWDGVISLFGRHVTTDVHIGDTLIPAGSQAALLYLAGNRDPRHYDNPNNFTIKRSPGDHLGFGFGAHRCAGETLARMQAHAIIGALARHTHHYTLTESESLINNGVHGYSRLLIETEAGNG